MPPGNRQKQNSLFSYYKQLKSDSI